MAVGGADDASTTEKHERQPSCVLLRPDGLSLLVHVAKKRKGSGKTFLGRVIVYFIYRNVGKNMQFKSHS